ncbi:MULTISPECIES: right-handed parallel beta-helix repeat-containing protein [unclassified Mesorhizobium]|uniref:right-handed parallel beta-helix repeat-containing protein n=1 Tax=unclassified Mesorhizobium TaxID=325217 RepID=UPI0030142EC4
MAQIADNVYRDFVTDGVPTSGKWQPRKAEIRELLRGYEGYINAFVTTGGLLYPTKASLDADLNPPIRTMAWVMSDPVVANNGVYRKTGGVGLGEWVRTGELPYSFIRASNVGAGTPNAIVATTSIPLPSADGGAIISLPIFIANTASPVTVAFNGASPLTIKANSGSNVAIGGLTAGMIVAGYVAGGTLRLISDQASAAIQAAAEAARDAAIDAQLAAEAAASAVELTEFATITSVSVYAPSVAPLFLRTAGYSAAGDGGGALYKKVASEPSHIGKFSITLADAVTVVWYEIADVEINPIALGADPAGTVNANTYNAMQAVLNIGRPMVLSAGTYYLSTHLRPVHGSNVVVRGAGRDLVTIKAAVNVVGFFCDATGNISTDNRVQNFDIEGVTFDGEWVRQTFPYNGLTDGTTTPRMRTAFALRGMLDGTSRLRVHACRFKSLRGPPFQVFTFRGSCNITENIFTRTKDPGILFCANGGFNDNQIEHSADNGFSLSRSNQNFDVRGNNVFGALTGGIFVGSVDLTKSEVIKATETGGGYGTGQVMALSAVTAGTFDTDLIGQLVTLVGTPSTEIAVMEVINVTSDTAATARALMIVPASLRATDAASWSIGPDTATVDFSVTENTVRCSGASNIYGTYGCKRGTVSDNSCFGAGIIIDSEKSGTGTINRSSPTLTLKTGEGAKFVSGDFVVIVPKLTHQDPFISKVSSVAGDVVTLADNAPEWYTEATVWRAERGGGNGWGVLFTGWYRDLSTGLFEYVEDLTVENNKITQFQTGGVLLGNSSGSARYCSVKNNSIRNVHPRIADGTANLVGVQIGEHSTDMRTIGNLVDGNQIRLTTDAMVTASRGVFVPLSDSSANSTIQIGDSNTFASCTQDFRITEAGVDMTQKYAPRSIGSDNFARLAAPIVLGARPHATKTLASGVLMVDQSLIKLNGTGGITVTSVTLSGMGVATPIIVIQNTGTGALDTVTLTHASGAFWCPNVANYVIPRRGGVICAVDDSTSPPTLQVLGPVA